MFNSPLPPRGTLVRGMSDVLGLLGRVSDVAASPFGVTGPMAGDVSRRGTNILPYPVPQLKCFEITSCWRSCNAPNKTGATDGKFWVCDAKPVGYWWGQQTRSSGSSGGPQQEELCGTQTTTESCSASSSESNVHESYWDVNPYEDARIFWAISSPADDTDWQKVLYPRFGIGQWVWCIRDEEADCWRAIEPYDDLVRFCLKEPLRLNCPAVAWIIGFPCRPSEGSSSSEGGGPGGGSSSSGSEIYSASQGSGGSQGSTPSAGSGCGSGFVSSAQESSAPASESGGSAGSAGSQGESQASAGSQSTCELPQPLSRGIIEVYDKLGVVNVSFPLTCVAVSGTTGWAKRCADSEHWEVVSFGQCECGSTSISTSHSQSTPASSAAGSESQTSDTQSVSLSSSASEIYSLPSTPSASSGSGESSSSGSSSSHSSSSLSSSSGSGSSVSASESAVSYSGGSEPPGVTIRLMGDYWVDEQGCYNFFIWDVTFPEGTTKQLVKLVKLEPCIRSSSSGTPPSESNPSESNPSESDGSDSSDGSAGSSSSTSLVCPECETTTPYTLGLLIENYPECTSAWAISDATQNVNGNHTVVYNTDVAGPCTWTKYDYGPFDYVEYIYYEVHVGNTIEVEVAFKMKPGYGTITVTYFESAEHSTSQIDCTSLNEVCPSTYPSSLCDQSFEDATATVTS